MNNLAISPYICLHALQIQNVKRNVVKKASINELNNNHNDITDYHENNDSNENNDNIEIINNNQNDTNDNNNNDNDNDVIPEPHFIDDNIFGTEIN